MLNPNERLCAWSDSLLDAVHRLRPLPPTTSNARTRRRSRHARPQHWPTQTNRNMGQRNEGLVGGGTHSRLIIKVISGAASAMN